MKSKPSKEVIKHSATIAGFQVSNDRISLLQRKIWNVLLANAYDELLNKDSYSIKIKDLAKVLNFDSNDIELLKKAVKEMQAISIQWNALGKDGEEWTSSQYMGEVTIAPRSGRVIYTWGPKLREKLYNPTMYAKINLAIQSRFKSKYSHILYELCVDYFIKKQGKGETPWIGIEDFKKLMGVENDRYCETFKRFNSLIIKRAVSEINEESDIFIEVNAKRESRKIAALKFHISPTTKINNVLTRLTEAPKQGELHFKSEDERKQELHVRMTKYFCLSDRQSKDILNSMFDLDQVEDILGMVERKIKRDEIMNVGAYTFKALKEDYRHKRSLFEIEKEQEAQDRKEKQIKEAKENEIIEELLLEYHEYKEKAVNEYASGLSRKEKGDLLKEFERDLNNFTKRLYRESGMQSAAVKESFTNFVTDNRLGEEVMTFPAFARQRDFFVEEVKKGIWHMIDIKKFLAER